MNPNFFPIGKAINNFDRLDIFFDNYFKNVSTMNTTITQRDEFIKLTIEMLVELNCFREEKIQDSGANKICEEIYAHAVEQLRSMDSKYKREKALKNSDTYVEPIELSSGFDFKMKKDKITGEIVRMPVQSTFQYVNIIKQLEAAFSDQDFEEMYVNYNTSDDHVCKEGVYERFCCGSVYQNSEFFKSNPLALQLKLFVDDFEPCDALKSKAGKHKTTAYYLQINNIPQKCLSKVNSIYLVALCNASDSKNEYTNTNNVLEVIVKDIQNIEKHGIKTKSDQCIKGTLVCGMFDNLGGNILYGLHGSFASNNYCRICTALKKDCQRMTVENPNLIRTIEGYNKCLEILESNDKTKDSKGIKTYCCLNDLEHFHIMKNITVDFMHDIFEGLIPFTLEKIFEHCVTEKIATMEHIDGLVDCFHFGDLHKSKPSKINLDKKNLGQSASQLYCLFINIPFILYKYQAKLNDIWAPVVDLLQIVQIITSTPIDDNDLKRLETLIHTYLDSFIELFGCDLKPKHHLLLHYIRVIRAMGPVVFFWVMRMESKHQFFKRIAQRTKNFVNLKKTMAQQHQEAMHLAQSPYLEEIIVSKKMTLIGYNIDCNKYQDTIRKALTMDMLDESFVVNSVQINGIKYKSDYLVVYRNTIYLIHHVIMHANRFWILCCHSYKIEKYETFSNSFILKKCDEIRMIDLNDIKSIHVYERKYLKIQTHVIVENLELYRLHQ